MFEEFRKSFSCRNLKNLTECSLIFQDFKIKEKDNIPKVSIIFQNVVESFGNLLEYSRDFQNIPECSRFFFHFPK